MPALGNALGTRMSGENGDAPMMVGQKRSLTPEIAFVNEAPGRPCCALEH